MKEKIKPVVIAVSLLVFSFYYTDMAIDFLRLRDPLMKLIKENSERFTVEPVDAYIRDNLLIPGTFGLSINHRASFQRMKRYGVYNESLLVFKEIRPSVSVDDFYDKFIMSGRGINNDVSLVFRVERNSNINEILNILERNGVLATFFVDGVWLENNRNLVIEMTEMSHQIEILSVNGSHDETEFNRSLNMLRRITNIRPKYCFALYDQKEILELCSSLKLHTVIPTIKGGNYPFQEVRRHLNKGAIIGLTVNSSTNIELETMINFIKQRGFHFNTLDYLLLEIRNNQK